MNSWNLPLRFSCPNNINILRYEDYHNLIKTFGSGLKPTLDQIGIDKEINTLNPKTLLNQLNQAKNTLKLRVLKGLIDREHIY